MPEAPPEQPRTPAIIFQTKGLCQWWNYPSYYFGSPGEYGTDFSDGCVQFGAPVGAIAGGFVVYSGFQGNQSPNAPPMTPGCSYGCKSIGYVVEVLATDGLYHYQHLNTASVTTGQTIQPGDTVGTVGGLPCDGCSTGAHIEVRWSNKPLPSHNYPIWQGDAPGFWVDPLQHFRDISGSTAIFPTSSMQQASGIVAGSLQNMITYAVGRPNPFKTNDDVAQFFVDVDTFLKITPWWQIDISTIPTIPILNSPNPIFIGLEMLNNMLIELKSLIFRIFLAALGWYLCYRVMSAVTGITISGTFGNVVSGVGKGLSMGIA